MSGNKLSKIVHIATFFLTVFLLSVSFVVLKSTADLDLWHRMAVGKIFSQTGWIIYHDIFSYFPAKDMWVDHEWLSGIIFYNIGRYLGDWGILTLQISIVFTVIFLVYKTNKLIWPEDKYRISYYIVVLLGIIPGLSSSLRCQAFTYLFFALWLYLLERIRRGETRFIWIFPVTMLLWANMHGGFLAGIGLVGFYIIGEFLNKKNISKYLLILACILPVTLINPYGIEYWTYLLEAVTMHRPHITEWEPFNLFGTLYNAPGAKVLFLFLLAGYGYKLISSFRARTYVRVEESHETERDPSTRAKALAQDDTKYDKVEIIALLVTTYLAFKHERHIIFFVIAAGCYGYKHFIVFLNTAFDKLRRKILDKIPEDRIDQAYFAKHSLIYVLLIMISTYIISSTPLAVTMEFYPYKAIEFIKINNISGNLFVPFNWGSYSLWKLYPQNRVSMDGRYEETYTNQSYYDSCALSFFKKDWETVLNKYNHDILLLKIKSEVYKKVKTLPEWKIVYENEKAAVFLPVTDKRTAWQMPADDEGYYVKTKYENRIAF